MRGFSRPDLPTTDPASIDGGPPAADSEPRGDAWVAPSRLSRRTGWWTRVMAADITIPGGYRTQRTSAGTDDPHPAATPTHPS